MSSQLQHRLLHFEVEPPAHLWEAVSEALDDQSTPVAEKLRSFEAPPPTQLWQQIEAGLENEAEVPSQAIPFYRRYAKTLRYSSAAAVLLLVAGAIYLLANNSGESNKVAQQSATTPESRKLSTPVKREVTLLPTEEAEDPAPRSSATDQKENDNSLSPSPDEESSTAKVTQRPSSSRYLTVASEDGQPVRLSKKVVPVFDCAEHSSALQRFQCKENIEALQKMASSLASPSSDFASLIDMIKTLEENR